MTDRCVCCGEYVVEGRQVCERCEATRPKELIKILKNKPTTITIPGELPDLNMIIDKSKSHWAAYSKTKKAFTNQVAWLAKGKGKFKRINLDVTYYCKNRRKDPDNIIGGGNKFVLDGLVTAGVIKNDGWRHVNDISCRCRLDRDNPRVVIKIREAN